MKYDLSINPNQKSLSLAISQWCVHELLIESSKQSNILITHFELMNTPLEKLTSYFNLSTGMIFEAVKVNLKFIDHSKINELSDKSFDQLPSVDGEILFNFFRDPECKKLHSCAFKMCILNYPNFSYFPWIWYGIKLNFRILHPSEIQLGRDKRFMELFTSLKSLAK